MNCWRSNSVRPATAPHLVCWTLAIGLLTTSMGLSAPTLVINEVMASNSKTLADPQGDFDDWIELYNAGRNSVDVAGMYLTDDRAVPRKWRIPTGTAGVRGATTVGSRSYLIVWLDGDASDPGLHATFRLSAAGDDLHLFDKDGVTLIDSLEFDEQTPDISFGRYPDGDGTLRFFGVPTPGKANNEGYLDEVVPLRFSHERGFYSSAFDVTIQTATEGARILYTLDGHAPNEVPVTAPTRSRSESRASRLPVPAEPAAPAAKGTGAILYTGPIHISKTTCLRVLAEKPGCKPTPVYTHTYVLDLRPELVSLPVVSLIGDAGGVFYEPNGVMAIVGGTYADTWSPSGADSYNNMLNRDLERPVSAEWFSVANDEGFGIDCGLRVHGSPYMRPRYVRQTGFWSGSGKISLRLYFRGDYGQNRLEYPLIPESQVEQFATVVLRAGHNDRTNPFIQDELLRRLHKDMGQAACSGTFANLFINGEYKGFYNVTEHVKEESCQDWFDSDRSWDVMTMSGIRDGDTASFDAMINYARSHNLADPTSYAELCRKLDVVSFIDYLIVRLWPNDWDWPQNNWSAACERSATGKWKFFVWDAEGTFRTSDLQVDRFGELGTQANANGYLYQALRANPDFRRLFADRLYKHFYNGGALTAENIQARFNELREGLRSIIPSMNSYIIDGWTPVRQAVFLNACIRVGMYTFAGPGLAINGVPQYGGHVSPGDRLSITPGGGRGIIYYTLDGTDPAQSGLPLGANIRQLVARNSPKRILVPTGPLPDDWRMVGAFDDSSWLESSGSPGGIGFGRGSGFESHITTNLGSRMYKVNGSCYLRLPFRFEGDKSKLADLILSVQYDDGFIAYLNGTEVARKNFEGRPNWNSIATVARDNVEAVTFEPFDLSGRMDLLQQGDNVLALQALNDSVNGSDFLIGAELTATEQSARDNPLGPQVYTGPIPLMRTTQVKARIQGGSTWSALAEAVFAVGPVKESLRISEIMYHPLDTGQPGDPNAEYLELTNVGAEALDLNFVKFTRGVQFTFPQMQLAPHAFCLVVKDRDAFETRYGAGLPVVGQYTGSLSDGGERIELCDAGGAVIHSFRYEDNWFRTTDGSGDSLTVKYPAGAPVGSWSTPMAWRPSATPGGSPGSDDSGMIPGPGAIIINELLAKPAAGGYDWIELHNTTDQTLDIGGWFLSDSADNLLKYEIAAGTKILPHGFLVFAENRHFGKAGTPGSHQSFGLSQTGESVYLCSGAKGQVTGYREQARFGASEAGMTFGRYVDGAGGAHLVPLRQATPGAANADPLVGPVVFTEILYHADNPGDVEYVELQNTSETEVVLYDPARQAPWRLAGGGEDRGIDFLFPQNPPVTLGPRAYLLLTKDRALLESRFGVFPSIQVLEWGAGSLADAGDTIELCRPGDLVNDTRTWLVLDRVTYSNGAHPEGFTAGLDPWSTQADGLGKSLTRTDPGGWGDNPLNWQAVTPSPGAARQRANR